MPTAAPPPNPYLAHFQRLQPPAGRAWRKYADLIPAIEHGITQLKMPAMSVARELHSQFPEWKDVPFTTFYSAVAYHAKKIKKRLASPPTTP